MTLFHSLSVFLRSLAFVSDESAFTATKYQFGQQTTQSDCPGESDTTFGPSLGKQPLRVLELESENKWPFQFCNLTAQ